MNKSKTSLKTTVEWKDINWRTLERRVFKLQKRIYKAAERGDNKAVRRLQKTLANSWSAKALATRKVTQDNKGKKIAGIDGIKWLNSPQKIQLAQTLKLNGKAKAARQIEIPQDERKEKPPFKIPTLEDRAKQALLQLALEPEWEAKFDGNSYGKRPKRSYHDAIEAIFSAIKQQPKYVLDADLSQCFDTITPEKLLAKLNSLPKFRRQIKTWLKSGLIDSAKFFEYPEGTAQSRGISPLLANIVLHALENDLKRKFSRQNLGMVPQLPDMIRYADDFVILHPDLNTVIKCKEFIAQWLSEMGLNLKPEKTNITHTLNNHQGKTGFDFLGFKIKQFKVSKNLSSQGFKTLITPSQKAQEQHLKAIHKVIYDLSNASQESLIRKLNPIIQGWCQYYSPLCSTEILAKIDHLIQIKLMRWGFRKHNGKSKAWVINKYWNTVNGDNWVFSQQENGAITEKLMRHHRQVKDSHVNRVERSQISHQLKTRNHVSCIHDKNHVTEERNEVKISRSVLKTSSSGDRIA
ncbi:reverse transcriptase N-terminal domain-containing protein [Gloeothece verrucosa]|nr:reverse transcriptase domain-containing protein [Gloeothece verrucosa]